MVGGRNRRDDGPLGRNSTNVFAALESLRRKKKTDKTHGSSKSKGSSENQAKEPEPQVFWAPAPLNVKSWADVDDDDDYYATTAPPQSVWASSEPQQTKDSSTPLEESESEDDGFDEGDDDVEEEPDHEPEVPGQSEPIVKAPPQTSLPPKDTERQLSKKELKKKGLAELDAVLAELGIPKHETGSQDHSHGVESEKKAEDLNGYVDKESATGESKNAKKKKKKDKSSKDVRAPLDHPNDPNINNGPDEAAGTEQAEEDASAIDVKERLKKMASTKKKKSNKEMDTAAKAAAVMAAARSAKLAAAKKKEKNHYNQQPVR
ncbi:hypothetical protein HHK36_014050 [Tetracentron sinense]|uniref:Uncharacterized protein n=1 Tax=Tetracentron sinense TaxID=13715 RepID=A0A834Z779_TETSI|nr:hypothetical protein HHK36_014050 [Tetracentron sinense]